MRKKITLRFCAIFIISLLPLSFTNGACFYSSISGYYPDNWVIFIVSLQTNLWSTGHVEGLVQFQIRAPSGSLETGVSGFYIFADAPSCDPNQKWETYGNDSTSPYYVQQGEPTEQHTEYIDIYLSGASWKNSYSTTVALTFWNGGFLGGTIRFATFQLYWVKVGSTYYAYSSGLSITTSQLPDLYLA